MFTYSTVKEMIKDVENKLSSGQKVVDSWQENRYYVLEIASETSANVTIKLLMPE